MSGGTVLEALELALRKTADHAANVERSPAAILWPDEGRQWMGAIPKLREVLPILTLGRYAPATWEGPAYWVRCVVDEGLARPAEGIPIVYMPGFARSQVRAVEDAPAQLRPVAELQYRGSFFSQKSNRDWTIQAFIQASPARGGLGIEVATDDLTKAAILRASSALMDATVDQLRRSAPLKARHFDAIMTPDIDRDVLRWLGDPASFRAGLSQDQWDSFRERFAERFGLELEAGEIEVARALGTHVTDAWGRVWQAFSDAPDRYPGVPYWLGKARPKRIKDPPGLWDSQGAWPQDNEEAEAALRGELQRVGGLEAGAARSRLYELEAMSATRRDWVWAELGEAPLASAMESLAVLAKGTASNVLTGSVADIVQDYVADRWRTDDAVMRALAEVESVEDAAAVGVAAAAVYRPWLEVAAERLAEAIRTAPGDYSAGINTDWPAGTCVIFTDGLRLDIGYRLASELGRAGVDVAVQPRLTALPAITPTGKPAATPAASRLAPGSVFGVRAEGGTTDLTADGLRREIREAGYQTLGSAEVGDPSGRAWAEQGDIDALGHEHQARLPALLDSEVRKLSARIRELLAAGWKQVVVVTDHGWLYLPGGLPKADLPIHLTKEGSARKSRAARLAAGASTDIQVVPWHWDPSVRIAVAPGIRVFSGSPVYDHGGISPQECITPMVIARASAGPIDRSIEIDVDWAGMRARVGVAGGAIGWQVDIRETAGDPESSVVSGARPFDADGKVSLLVEDEALEGGRVLIVILDDDGRIVAQEDLVIGGGD